MCVQVRWADIEERAEQLRRREVGFIVGQTDWDKLNDDNYAHRALNQTKYIWWDWYVRLSISSKLLT